MSLSNDQGHIFWYVLISIPAWISIYINQKAWDVITYPFPDSHWNFLMDK